MASKTTQKPTAARNIEAARSLRRIFENVIPKAFFSDDPKETVYGDPQVITAYDFCKMIEEQAGCTFRAASKAAVKVVPELFADYWQEVAKKHDAEAA